MTASDLSSAVNALDRESGIISSNSLPASKFLHVWGGGEAFSSVTHAQIVGGAE